MARALRSVKIEEESYFELEELKLSLSKRKGISVPRYAILSLLIKGFKKKLESQDEQKGL
jgi:hypothetical protein